MLVEKKTAKEKITLFDRTRINSDRIVNVVNVQSSQNDHFIYQSYFKTAKKSLHFIRLVFFI